jgi:signal transduction histidine kinase/DNA-binding NarL/FixJ family response regulator
MKTEQFAPALLARLGYAVFEDAGCGALTPVGALPDWFARAFGADAVKEGRFLPGDSSPFLENFLPEAKAAWVSGDASLRAQSGAWIECGPGGEELALEAEAFLLDGRHILLVAHHQERYDETVRMLQIARNDKLSHERLQKEIQNKEVLLHCIVHDLSQPLTALRGCLSLLSLGLPPEKMREVVEIADRQTRRQENMIRDVLKVFASEMAVLQSGASAEGVDAAKCAREVVQEYSAAFASQGAALALDSRLQEGSEHRVVGEAERLRRLFTNYLENALRYSPAGTTVTVGVEQDGEYLRAFVDDQGPGLPEGVTAANLFRLFGKGKESTGKAGLGLYFCKITAERWGGGVGCENRAGGGTRFWFRLPRVRAANEPLVQTAAPVADAALEMKQSAAGAQNAPEAPSRVTRPLRILLAEDVEINREVAEELLTRRGHRVTSVEDGRAALAAVEREKFDLVLMDVEMPVMDGLEAARAIRVWEGGGGERLPILAVTAHDSPQDRENILRSGMDGHVLKPFDGDTLERAIAAALSPTAAHATTAGTDAATEKACASPARTVPEILVARCGGDLRLATSLARMFLQDSPRLVDAVFESVARGDAEGIARSAHALKGAVGNFGAQEAREAAAHLEQLGRHGDLGSVAEAFERLTREVTALREELTPLAGNKTGRKTARSASGEDSSKHARHGPPDV